MEGYGKFEYGKLEYGKHEIGKHDLENAALLKEHKL
jgi:hypothetical protein